MNLNAAIRAQLEPWSPYAFTDQEIDGAIHATVEKWAGIQRQIDAMRLPRAKDFQWEPLSDEWIIWDAACLLDVPEAFKPPGVYVRSEAWERRRATRPQPSRKAQFVSPPRDLTPQ